MELETLVTIEKIASKLKIKDRAKRLETAKELNELAKILIEWKNDNEQSNTLH